MKNAGKTKLYYAGTLSYTLCGLVALFCWLLWGDFAWSMKDRAVGSIAALTVKSFGISDFAFSLLIASFPSFTNIFLGPIISYRSDRHRGRWGRRIPFLAMTTPFVVVGVCGIGCSRLLAEWLYPYLPAGLLTFNMLGLLIFGFFWICLDFGATLSGALSGALINDVVPRCFLGRFFALFRAISLGAGILFNYCLLGRVEQYAAPICLGLGILYAAGLSAMCLKVKEGEYPPPEITTGTGWNKFTDAIRSYFRECFSHPFYRQVMIGYTLCGLGTMPFNLFTVFYAKSIGLEMEELGKFFALTFVISFALCYLLGALADMFHPLRAGICAMIIYAVLMLCGGFMVHDQSYFIFFFVAHGIISGMFYTLTASIGQRLFPQERFAQFNSALGLVSAVGATLLPLLAGAILDWSGNTYRYTFFIGFAISAVGITIMLQVYRQFKTFGGCAAYRCPPYQDQERHEQ